MIFILSTETCLSIISIVVSIVLSFAAVTYTYFTEKRLQKSERNYNRRLDKLYNVDKLVREDLSSLIIKLDENKIDYRLCYKEWKIIFNQIHNHISFLYAENNSLFSILKLNLISLDDSFAKIVNNIETDNNIIDLKSKYKQIYKILDDYITNGKIDYNENNKHIK